jgi:transcriptional pleiotropic repressor
VSLPNKITQKHELISEYMGGVLGLLLGKELAGVEQSKLRARIQARKALQALSYSEIITLQKIFTCLDVNYEGFFVAGEVAAELGITRSVIVNALKKLRSANILESRSLGMKGTFVRVLNQEIIEMVNSHDYRSLQSLQKN